MVENWLPIAEFNGLYEVSNRGNVRSSPRQGSKGGIVKPSIDARGYQKVSLYNKGRKARWVHRLVLEAFVGLSPEGTECCHGDGNPSNNHLTNLRWATRSENYRDAVRHGTAAIGERNGQTKVTPSALAEMRQMRACGAKHREIAAEFGFSQQHVSALLSGDRP